MCSVFKCLCVFNIILHLSLVNLGNGVQVEKLIESKHNLAFGEPLAVQRADIRYNGVFENFLRNLFNLLTKGFPERKLIRYCRVLSRHLGDMEYKYTKMLAKRMRHLSRMYREDVKQEIEEYGKELEKQMPMRTAFLEAMNAAFTLREKVLFNDYIFDVRDYGNEDKPFIEDETRKLLNMILESVLKLSRTDQKELERRLRKAIKEYRRENILS